MSGEFAADVVAELERRVAEHLPLWGLPADTQIVLLNLSENATFGLRAPGRDWVLRVHRVGYSSAEEIESELAWMASLRRDGVIDTALPMAGVNGELVQWLVSRSGAAPRYAVAFERLTGREPEVHDALAWFEHLGEITARLHRHARSWPLPSDFRRKRWNVDAMVGEQAYWGSWRDAIGLDGQGSAVIERALERARQRLDTLGDAADVFGLVHADLRLANLLVDGEHLRVIDFDDCGFSWFLYDFAAAISFIELEPIVPRLLQAWLLGYGKIAAVDARARAEIPTFVLLRRVLLTAWLASHAEVPFAVEKGAGYTRGTVILAQRFLRDELLIE
jgi:Ser/Thr protein kinase RdoA (MazF antagonist)